MVPYVLPCFPMLSPIILTVLPIVLPWLPMLSPCGSCFQTVGPQRFVNYLAKYAVILGIDDIAFDGREDKLY